MLKPAYYNALSPMKSIIPKTCFTFFNKKLICHTFNSWCDSILLCVPDSGTTFFWSLLTSKSSLAYQIPIHLQQKKKSEHYIQISSSLPISQFPLCIASYNMQFHILTYFEFHMSQSIPYVYSPKFVPPLFCTQNPAYHLVCISLQWRSQRPVLLF